MCNAAHSIVNSCECLIQLFIRTLMTFALMMENMVRLILQTIYNLLSFLIQLISLIPVCCVFLITSKLRCVFCGGGGGCASRGGSCDCVMTILALLILFLIFRATGILDKILHKLGYTKTGEISGAGSTGTVTDCSRNESMNQWYDYYNDEDDKSATSQLKEMNMMAMENQTDTEHSTTLDSPSTMIPTIELIETTDVEISKIPTNGPSVITIQTTQILMKRLTQVEYLEVYSTNQQDQQIAHSPRIRGSESSNTEWTTVLYYLVA